LIERLPFLIGGRVGYFDDFHLCACALGCPLERSCDQRWPNFYSVQFLVEGTMLFGRDRRGQTRLNAPALYWINPAHTYQKGPAEGGNLRHVAVFRGARGRRLVREGFDGLSGEGYTAVHDPASVLAVFVALDRWATSPSASRQGEVVLLMERLLVAAAASPADGGGDDPHRDDILRIAEQIRRHPLRRHDVEGLARRAHLSYPHFRRLFRRHLGRPPYEYVLSHRMQWAARELRDRRVQVKEIALRAGYEDQSKFTRAFKSRFGVPPTIYRSALT
jgi:AraC-like DNA-binding protein